VVAQAASATPVEVARSVVDAVNARDATAYVAAFAEDAEIRLYDGEVRLRGRSEIEQNRRRHFERYPDIRAEVLHLVEIGDRVVRHDRVWLAGEAAPAVDIVEIVTFRGGAIVRVDVIQPPDLLGTRPASGR
jgi:hypothetical protein